MASFSLRQMGTEDWMRKGRRFPGLGEKSLSRQRLGLVRCGIMGMRLQRIQKTPHLCQHELTHRRQGMHAERLAGVINQDAPQRASFDGRTGKACGHPQHAVPGQCRLQSDMCIRADRPRALGGADARRRRRETSSSRPRRSDPSGAEALPGPAACAACPSSSCSTKCDLLLHGATVMTGCRLRACQFLQRRLGAVRQDGTRLYPIK